jgi:hypothetical protein
MAEWCNGPDDDDYSTFLVTDRSPVKQRNLVWFKFYDIKTMVIGGLLYTSERHNFSKRYFYGELINRDNEILPRFHNLMIKRNWQVAIKYGRDLYMFDPEVDELVGPEVKYRD